MDDGVEIRTDFPPDDAAISALHRLAFGSEPTEPEPWGDRLRLHSVTWAGAFHGDELVAFVHVVWDGGRHGFLLDTVVHPAHQRTGLGRAVVLSVTERARAAGCTWLHVDFEPHLRDFYAACGFEPTCAGLMRLR